jgi:hypothetical protein
LPLQGRFRFNWQPQSQRIYYGTAIDSEGRVVDEVLLLAMLRPRSYTREDVIELHTHGGGVCAQRVLRACIEAGARPARPGEFTLRAFLNGRMDLSQVRSIGGYRTSGRDADLCQMLDCGFIAWHCAHIGRVIPALMCGQDPQARSRSILLLICSALQRSLLT